jgi:hypothetical protein
MSKSIPNGNLKLRRKEVNVLPAFRWKGGGVGNLPGWLKVQEIRFDRKKNILEVKQRIGATLHVQPGEILVLEQNKIHCHGEEFVEGNFEVLPDKPEKPEGNKDQD